MRRFNSRSIDRRIKAPPRTAVRSNCSPHRSPRRFKSTRWISFVAFMFKSFRVSCRAATRERSLSERWIQVKSLPPPASERNRASSILYCRLAPGLPTAAGVPQRRRSASRSFNRLSGSGGVSKTATLPCARAKISSASLKSLPTRAHFCQGYSSRNRRISVCKGMSAILSPHRRRSKAFTARSQSASWPVAESVIRIARPTLPGNGGRQQVSNLGEFAVRFIIVSSALHCQPHPRPMSLP